VCGGGGFIIHFQPSKVIHETVCDMSSFPSPP
jgi:hypothetical protein